MISVGGVKVRGGERAVARGAVEGADEVDRSVESAEERGAAAIHIVWAKPWMPHKQPVSGSCIARMQVRNELLYTE
eukprot:5489483-Amphidinium_carterae.1